MSKFRDVSLIRQVKSEKSY